MEGVFNMTNSDKDDLGIRYLAFEGGGGRGAAYVGAVKAFPHCRFSDLFYIARKDSSGETAVTITYRRYGSALRSN